MLTPDMFITAEDSQSPRPGVWVLLEAWSLRVERGIVPAAFVVRTSTGYRAELRACMFDGHAPDFVNCVRDLDDRHMHSGMSMDRWFEHCRTHCHSYHLPRAEAFRDEVMATYGSASKRQNSLAGLLAHPYRVRNVSAKAWAENPYAAALEGRLA